MSTAGKKEGRARKGGKRGIVNLSPHKTLIIFRPVKQNFITQSFGIKGTKASLLSMYQSLGLIAHNGIDFACQDKVPVYFNVDGRGTIIGQYIDKNGGLGLDIVTEDKDGKFKHRYWHLHSFKCSVGDIVESGDLIALADNTGLSTGPHVHYGLKPVYLDDKGNYKNTEQNNGFWGAIDPAPYFKNIYIIDHMKILLGTTILLKKQLVGILQKLLKLIKK